MTCYVKIIEDSINPYNGIRLTTMQLKYWRGFHQEFLTHRVFSRNASSSRAIPVSTFLKQVWHDPAGPVHWGANNAGMQSKQELTGFKKWFTQFTWNATSKLLCIIVYILNKVASPHKQLQNRLLEPFQWMNVIVTSTEWDNFFALRNHSDAQPEIAELAQMMQYALNNSVPVERFYHLPYVSQQERETLPLADCFKISTARIARVSYLTHDGQYPDYEKDVKLHDRLVGSVPLHASPAESAAGALRSTDFCKNFRGWQQYRCSVEKFINNNNN